MDRQKNETDKWTLFDFNTDSTEWGACGEGSQKIENRQIPPDPRSSSRHYYYYRFGRNEFLMRAATTPTRTDESKKYPKFWERTEPTHAIPQETEKGESAALDECII